MTFDQTWQQQRRRSIADPEDLVNTTAVMRLESRSGFTKLSACALITNTFYSRWNERYLDGIMFEQEGFCETDEDLQEVFVISENDKQLTHLQLTCFYAPQPIGLNWRAKPALSLGREYPYLLTKNPDLKIQVFRQINFEPSENFLSTHYNQPKWPQAVAQDGWIGAVHLKKERLTRRQRWMLIVVSQSEKIPIKAGPLYHHETLIGQLHSVTR